MGRAVDDLETLELLGSTQWGLVTAAQAQEAGLTRVRLSRLTDRATLRRVRHGVYALPSASSGRLQDLRAAWLATGSRPVGTKPIAVVSGQSAAAAHGIGDLVPSAYEFSTPVRRQSTLADIRYRTRDLPDSDVAVTEGLPVTTVARTVADLAAGGTDQEHLATAVHDAHSAGTSSEALARALAPQAKTSGHADGQTYLLALLDLDGYQLDPALAATLERFSDAAVRAFTPQMKQTMSNMVEQMARQSGLIAPAIDPKALEGITASLTRQLATHSNAVQSSLLSPRSLKLPDEFIAKLTTTRQPPDEDEADRGDIDE